MFLLSPKGPPSCWRANAIIITELSVCLPAEHTVFNRSAVSCALPPIRTQNVASLRIYTYRLTRRFLSTIRIIGSLSDYVKGIRILVTVSFLAVDVPCTPGRDHHQHLERPVSSQAVRLCLMMRSHLMYSGTSFPDSEPGLIMPPDCEG